MRKGLAIPREERVSVVLQESVALISRIHSRHSWCATQFRLITTMMARVLARRLLLIFEITRSFLNY